MMPNRPNSLLPAMLALASDISCVAETHIDADTVLSGFMSESTLLTLRHAAETMLGTTLSPTVSFSTPYELEQAFQRQVAADLEGCPHTIF